MHITPRHRKVARVLWEYGGRIADVAAHEHVRATTLRRWLRDPEFRSLLAQDALEPLLQATSAVVRWAPAAVARLIEDLRSDSPAEARQAAREVLKLALEAQRDLTGAGGGLARAAADLARDGGEAAPADDPLSRRVAGLSDERLAQVLELLNAR
jgi:hypothetical protein